MDGLRFEWDLEKAKTNIEKHGVSFEEATTVFTDELAILFDDPEHSDYEERSIIMGISSKTRMLLVCHCLRCNGDVIRIISARKATKYEEKQYIEINKRWKEK